jgi:uncharacterized membrane protein
MSRHESGAKIVWNVLLVGGSFVAWCFVIAALGLFLGGTGLILAWIGFIIVFFIGAVVYLRWDERRQRKPAKPVVTISDILKGQ